MYRTRKDPFYAPTTHINTHTHTTNTIPCLYIVYYIHTLEKGGRELMRVAIKLAYMPMTIDVAANTFFFHWNWIQEQWSWLWRLRSTLFLFLNDTAG